MKKRVMITLLLLYIFRSTSSLPEVPSEDNVFKQRHEKVDKLKITAIQHLKEVEGFRSKPYKCSAQQWTIGYGHGLIGHWIDNISENEAEKLLIKDFDYFLNYISKDLGITLNENPGKVIALALFTFNVGTGNWHRSTLRKKILKGETIEKEIIKWCHIKGKKSNHLLQRREFELSLYTNF